MAEQQGYYVSSEGKCLFLEFSRRVQVPIYVVELHADGILIELKSENSAFLGVPVSKNSDSMAIRGFFTHRVVKAKSEDVAVKKVTKMVLDDWTSDEYANINTEQKPNIEVENVFRISLWTWLTTRPSNKGYSFYIEDGKSGDMA